MSILKELKNVEVLSLSVNKISSLYDFQFCKNLKELYLRKNLINDLSEIYYLKVFYYLIIIITFITLLLSFIKVVNN